MMRQQLMEDDEEALLAEQMHAGMGGMPDEGEPDLMQSPPAEMTDRRGPLKAAPTIPDVQTTKDLGGDKSTGGSKDSWSPDFLGAIAAWTKNPELMRRVAERDARPEREAAAKSAAVKEKREQEKHELEQSLLAPLKADEKRQKIQRGAIDLQTARDASTPGSEYSKAMRSSIAQKLGAQAAVVGQRDPKVAQLLQTASDNMMKNGGMSAMQAIKVAENFGDVGRLAVSQAHNIATESLAKAGLAVRREGLQQADEHFNEAQDNKVTAKLEKDQERLNEKVAGLNENDELMGMVKEDKGKVNTGWLANKLQGWRKIVGGTDNGWDTLEGTLAAVNNQIIKLQAGGNVTSGEAARMRQQLPSMDMDDSEFGAKLDTVINQIGIKKKNAGKQYQRNPNGEVRDTAPIGRELVGKKPAPHGQRVKQNGHVFEWNGSEYVEAK